MAPDRSYIAENDRERRRLEALVGKLDDAALSRPMPDGRTVAGVLAHLAFWDQRIPTFIDVLERGEKVPEENPIDVEWINAAAKPTQVPVSAGIRLVSKPGPPVQVRFRAPNDGLTPDGLFGP